MLNAPRAINFFFFQCHSDYITDLGYTSWQDNNGEGATKVCANPLNALVTPMRKSDDKVVVMLAQIRGLVSLLPLARHVAQVNVNCHFILLRRLIFWPRDPRKLYGAQMREATREKTLVSIIEIYLEMLILENNYRKNNYRRNSKIYRIRKCVRDI